MDVTTLNTIKIIFLFGFTLHNIEEAVWLPQWSKYAQKFHEPVESNQFVFAVIVVTIIGYILTALGFLTGNSNSYVNYIYLGFVGMMGINALFPHLIATIVLKKYAPGLVTALFLNLPLSLILIVNSVKNGLNPFYVLAAMVFVGGIVLFSLKYLFRLGQTLIDY